MNYKINIEDTNNWVKSDIKPLIISGPCSAETEEQVLSTAKALTKIPNVKIFRAGIWKPRTRPDSFEGVGSKGLLWLKKVKQQTGLLTAVEVATTKHIDQCLKNNVDILWLGARTVVNPFSVQEISQALKGVDIPVMIKNPVNPDIKLWIGAIERINHSGIKKIIAIHRGFYSYEKTQYRNSPMWEIPIELKRIFPEIPVICDPSHICGNKELLLSVSQKALDLEMDGLMIESHINPDKALTDANQQLTPDKLNELLSKLVIRDKKSSYTKSNILDNLREEIFKTDIELINIISKRLEIVKEVGEYKQKNNITILQLNHWHNVIKSRLEIGEQKNLDKDFLLKLLQIIHKESIRKQIEIMEKQKRK